MSNIISRGFTGRRVSAEVQKRIPPGQHLEQGFPVLSYGPTPHTPLDEWNFTLSFEDETCTNGTGANSNRYPMKTSKPIFTASRHGANSIHSGAVFRSICCSRATDLSAVILFGKVTN
jgi:hypothetical protein